MNDRKTEIRFFTIADYEEEEVWLHDQHKNGWKLLKMIPPCFYIFEKCVPDDVVYRLDYKNNTENDGYFQIFGDYGWEYIGRCVGWLYFRKPLSETESGQDRQRIEDRRDRPCDKDPFTACSDNLSLLCASQSFKKHRGQ